MKRIFVLIVTAFIALTLSSCNINKDNSTALDNDATFEKEEIRYEIEQIVFSKSFQSLDPSVEVITKNNRLKIMASLGLAEYSSVNVNKIVKKGREVNIHVSGIRGENNLRLAVPQVVMELRKSDLKNTEDLKFNIIYDDYTPLKVKLGINDVINKIQSHFKVSIKGLPIFSLSKENDHILWNINYNNIFDKENPDIPLVNLFAQVDANTGDIINSEKTFISSSLDYGHILNYIPNNHLLYKKLVVDDDTNITIEQLWYYDANNGEKVMLYSSNFKILSSQLNPNQEYVSLIEVNETSSDLYVISLEDKRAFKVSFENKFNPKLIRWKDNDLLYMVETIDNRSTVYSYSISNNETNLIGKFNKNIENLVIMNENFLIAEKSKDEYNQKLSITEDWKAFKFIDYGFRPRFINENKISYIQNDEKKNSNSLLIYDCEERDNSTHLKDENLLNYEVLPDKNIVYIKKNSNNNDFTLSKYYLDNETIEDIVNLISDKIFYDEINNLVYLNTVLPFEDNKKEMIYSIDLNKLN